MWKNLSCTKVLRPISLPQFNLENLLVRDNSPEIKQDCSYQGEALNVPIAF